MSSRRSILFLVCVLVLSVAAHLAINSRGGDGAGLIRRTMLLPGADSATYLAVDRDGGRAFALVRSGAWRIVEPFSAGAEGERVMRMTDALAFTPVEDTLSEAEMAKLGRRIDDFGLKPPRVSVTVGKDGEKVDFGAPTPSGDGVYVCVSGDKSVYIVPTNVLGAVDVDADSVRQRSVLSVSPASVTGFDIRLGAGKTLRFARRDDGWHCIEPSDQKAADAKVDALVAGVLTATATGFVWPTGRQTESRGISDALLAGFGLDPDAAVSVTFTCRDGTGHSVAFGRAAGEGLVYALVQEGKAVVTVASALLDGIVAGSGNFTDGRLFPLAAADVAAFSVADGETVYMLARDAADGWRLDSPVAAPADKAAAEALLAKVLALGAADRVANGLRVSVGTNGAPVTVSHAAVAEGTDFSALRSREVVKILPEEVRRVSVTAGSVTNVVVYDRERRTWNVEASAVRGVASQTAVASLLAKFSPLAAERVVTLKVAASELGNYGLEAPVCRVAIDLDREDVVRRNLTVGDRTQGGYYATLGSSDAVFVLSDALVAALTAPLVTE